VRARDRVVVVGILLVGAPGTGCVRTPAQVLGGHAAPPQACPQAPDACERIVSIAPPRLQADARRVCRADSYDRSAMARRESARSALECLVAHGASRELFAAFARHESAVVRTYGREGLERVRGWTPELLREAVLDGARVPGDEGEPPAAHYGVAAMIQSDPGLAAVMLPTLLQTSRDSDVLVQIVARAGREPWIAERDLERVASDPQLSDDVHAFARQRLTERRGGTLTPTPASWGRTEPLCLDDLERAQRQAERAERERALQLEREWLETAR